MASPKSIAALLLLLVFASFELSSCQVVKGKVSCLDCKQKKDLSGTKVLVKCDRVKKLAVATTELDGSFKVELPSDAAKPPSRNCHAKLLGGPIQFYVSRKNRVSRIVKTHEPNSYTISAPLTFLTSCPTKDHEKCKASNEFGPSKTFDLPLPPEWGFAPSSYYIPFFPIIGIP